MNISREQFKELKAGETSYNIDYYKNHKDARIGYVLTETNISKSNEYGNIRRSYITTYNSDTVTPEFLFLYENQIAECLNKLVIPGFPNNKIDFTKARHMEIYFDKKVIIFERKSIIKTIFLAHWIAYMNRNIEVGIYSYTPYFNPIKIIYDSKENIFKYSSIRR